MEYRRAVVQRSHYFCAPVSGVLIRALRTELQARRETKWRDENKAAIEESNAEAERNGLWCDKYRGW